MKKLLASLILAAPIAAMADPHSYTYIEAGWFDRTAEWDLEVDGLKDEVEADGWSIAGSYRTEGGVLFQGYYSEGEVDKAWGTTPSETARDVRNELLLMGFDAAVGVDFDVTSWGILIGGANYLDDKTSFWGGFGYGRDELKFKVKALGTTVISESYDVDQYSFGGGVRHNIVPMLELNGSARVVHFRADESDSLEDFQDTDVEVTVGARFQPVKLVSIGASYARQLDADSEMIRADVRLQF